MALYRYVKAESHLAGGSVEVVGLGVTGGWMRIFTGSFPGGTVVAVLLVMVGGGLLSFSLAPIVAYELVVAPRLVAPILSPVVEGPVAAAGESGAVLGESSPDTDLVRASSWFPDAPPPAQTGNVGKYSLWIPKLAIEGATVVVGGEDLSHSLVHYGGTALPGQPGNAVIFGHSVLPQFYNPKNYMTIFSTLPTLAKGDEMIVNFDGVTYKYEVAEMFEVKPADIAILEQKYSDSYLTLVTCVPPGTYMRRLVVRGRLVRPNGEGERSELR